MIEKSISLGDRIIHIVCIGKREIESQNLESRSIQEIVSFCVKKNLKVFYLEQEHKTEFHEIHSSTMLPLKGDAFYTSEKNLALVIKTADCIPIFFWSKEISLIGAIHSGWRGTYQNITSLVCGAVTQKFQIKNLDFYLGPCIRKKNYEVDEDVARLFLKTYPESLEKKENKYLFSNDFVVKKQIENLPIITSIEDSEICNFTDRNYYSYRRKDLGRNLNIIYME